jgi:predicted Zn-dependent protease
MRGESELRRIAAATLAASDADQAEVLLYGVNAALTRFANNQIHQNVDEDDLIVQVRAVVGGRAGVASTNDTSQAGLEAVAARAAAFARLQPEGEAVSLPSPRPIARIDAFNPATAACGPEQRAHVVREICEAAKSAGLTAAGAFRIGVSELAVANTLGVWGYHRDATADINTVVFGADSSGHAERLSLDAGEIDGATIAAEAIEACRRGANPRAVEPGSYDVVLMPYAVADTLDFFASLSFGARAVEEKRSFMAGRLGEKLMADIVSIWDDGASLDGIPSPFDPEGVPVRRVDFIRNGVAVDIAYDSRYGARAGRESTGHAVPAGNPFGPLPGNLFLAPGDASLDDLIASTERGILVSRFWYTRTVHPLNVVVTGMTRDGTFLIEKGRIAGPVHNLRFTQSYLEAMQQVDLIGRETMLLPSDSGGWIKTIGSNGVSLPSLAGSARVPALKLRGWNFTGTTDF